MKVLPTMPRAVAEINVAAIQRNVSHLRTRLGAASLCAVVKADAYGHGAGPVASAALDSGASMLAVATADEAAGLRDAGLNDVRILVLGALSSGELSQAVGAGAEVVAWDEGFIRLIARQSRHPVRVHVKLDTGMGRLGTRSLSKAVDVAAVIQGDPHLQLAGIATHLATSDSDLAFASHQLRSFDRLVRALARPGVAAHAANSAATLRLPSSHYDMARCGIALYGADPMNENASRFGLDPALALRSYVAAVKRIDTGQSAGYGRGHIASTDSWLATVPIGYGDGVSRALSNEGEVLIGGRRYPIVGLVSMDNLTVDLGPRPSRTTPTVAVGDPVTLIGTDGAERISLEDIAKLTGTINYEVLARISKRVHRRYHHDGQEM